MAGPVPDIRTVLQWDEVRTLMAGPVPEH
jgi:hypothetical protein